MSWIVVDENGFQLCGYYDTEEEAQDEADRLQADGQEDAIVAFLND